MTTTPTLQSISDKLDNISKITLMGAKTVLELSEASMFTGLSIGHLYRLTSGKQIPHYKKKRKLYFKKSDLEEWMLEQQILTERQIQKKATTYTVLNKR